MKFRKKPVVVEAFQMTKQRRQDNSEWPNWLHEAWQKNEADEGALYCQIHEPDSELYIFTLEGTHRVGWGDWIIQGVKGELYPCKPDIFAATYAPEACVEAPITIEGSIYEGMEASLVRSGRTISHVYKYADAVALSALPAHGDELLEAEAVKLLGETLWAIDGTPDDLRTMRDKIIAYLDEQPVPAPALHPDEQDKVI